MGVEIESRQQGVVIEHFLEMRDQPVGVGGVARESAGDLVVDAAPGHLLQCQIHHLQGPVVVTVAVVSE